MTAIRSRVWLAIGLAALIAVTGYLTMRNLLDRKVQETSIQPQFVTPVGADGSPTDVDVGFAWSEHGYCLGQLHVTATETPTEVRVNDVVSRTEGDEACAGVGSNGRWASVQLPLRAPIGNRLVVRASDRTALPVFALKMTLRCTDAIASEPTPSSDRVVMFNKVGLPKKALQASPSGESDPSAKLFAKDGLVVASGSTFTLRVPEEWMGRASIGWGSPATRTLALYVSGCDAGGRWLVFAGGFWVAEPSCVPVIVESPNVEQTVMVGVGKACPGQAEPPPAM